MAAGTARADEPLPNSVPSVMDRQWAFAIGFAGGVMQPQTDDTRLFAYGLIQAALRYRPLDVLEVGVSMTSGGTFDYGQAGLYADLRYRLMAEEAWNPFLLLGVGASLATSSNMSPLNDFRRSLRLGVGIERRFVSWGFAAEVHLFAIGGKRRRRNDVHARHGRATPLGLDGPRRLAVGIRDLLLGTWNAHPPPAAGAVSYGIGAVAMLPNLSVSRTDVAVALSGIDTLPFASEVGFPVASTVAPFISSILTA